MECFNDVNIYGRAVQLDLKGEELFTSEGYKNSGLKRNG
jgi:hypothetical protein